MRRRPSKSGHINTFPDAIFQLARYRSASMPLVALSLYLNGLEATFCLGFCWYFTTAEVDKVTSLRNKMILFLHFSLFLQWKLAKINQFQVRVLAKNNQHVWGFQNAVWISCIFVDEHRKKGQNVKRPHSLSHILILTTHFRRGKWNDCVRQMSGWSNIITPSAPGICVFDCESEWWTRQGRREGESLCD